MSWFWAIVIGGIAGWLAGLLMSGRGFGILGNIVVGIIGAIIGSWVFGALDLTTGFFLESLFGAIILLFLAGMFKRPNAS